MKSGPVQGAGKKTDLQPVTVKKTLCPAHNALWKLFQMIARRLRLALAGFACGVAIGVSAMFLPENCKAEPRAGSGSAD